jgi:hypothetical protein
VLVCREEVAMQVIEVTRISSPSDENQAQYVVRADGGSTFELSFQEDLLDVWREQLARSSTVLDLDSIAERLAEGIAEITPSPEALHGGVVVTRDNGAATPVAAENNLHNSGIGPFLRHDVSATHDAGAS